MQYIYLISMVTENKIRVLQRIAGVLAKNRLNVLNMNVHEISGTETSYFNVTFRSDAKVTTRVVLQLQRIIEVLEININNQVLENNPSLENAA